MSSVKELQEKIKVLEEKLEKQKDLKIQFNILYHKNCVNSHLSRAYYRLLHDHNLMEKADKINIELQIIKKEDLFDKKDTNNKNYHNLDLIMSLSGYCNCDDKYIREIVVAGKYTDPEDDNYCDESDKRTWPTCKSKHRVRKNEKI